MLSLLTVALACTSLLAEPPVRSDEFEPVPIHAVELPPAPLPAPVIAEPPVPIFEPVPVVEPAPARCIADRRCRGMRIAGISVGVLGLAAVGTGLGLITRDDRVIPETPAFVTSTRPPGLVVLTLGVGVTLTAALVLIASRSATRAKGPARRAQLEGLGLRF
jgi:hypothetical protein